ncbi:hypothetical protein Ndes2526B_g01216 [Nannochloris sp. 'desiccata']
MKAIVYIALILGVICSLVNGELTKIASVLDRAGQLEDWLIATRREFHQYPELMFEEFNTSATIRRHLDAMKISYKHPVAKTGVVATIGSGSPVIALRADIDALPIEEESGVPFPSTKPGLMHACGHDGHITMLLGAAKLLKERESELKGTVKLLFQPAEEGGAGGDIMVQEGALKGVDAAFGLHLWPTIPTGVLATRPGTIMAGAIQFKVTITGAGGHGAIPHLTRDPVVAATSAVTALQTLVSRNTSPFASAVVSITKLWAGGAAYNVIPDEAHFGGTMRATTDEDMKKLRHRLEKVVQGQAESFGCTATVDWMEETMPYYPPLVNDPSTADFLGKVAGEVLGDTHVITDVEPTMAGEDFAFIARAVPSAFAFLGIRNDTIGTTHGLHTAQYMMDEGALKLGAAVHTAVVLRYMETGGDLSKLLESKSSRHSVKDEL